MAPAPNAPFEPRLLRLRKRRVARGFAEAAFLHARAAEDLAERLEAIPRRFESVAVLGSGELFARTLADRPALRERLSALAAYELEDVDLDALPFDEQQFDLVVSPLVLHWANDLPGAFIQIRRALTPDGLMLASLFGGETLNELRFSLLEAEAEITGGAAQRVSPFAQLQDLAGLLQRAGFALPAADRDVVTVRYAHPLKLIADLRAMGETAAFAERAPRGLSKRTLARMLAIYAKRYADPDTRIRATFEIVTATGWAPHESQQKPLKPGSAKTRLADVLGVSETKVKRED